MSLTRNILAEEYTEANLKIDNIMHSILSRKLVEMKKEMVAESFGDTVELETLDEGKRFRIVKVRIRRGKIERRKKVSNVKGFTFRKRGKGSAKLIRMKPLERRKRKLGAKRGKVKRRGKKAKIKQKMRIVNRKRKALGLK